MRLLTFISLMTFAALIPSVPRAETPVPAWQEYRSDEAGFKAEFPGKPEAAVKDLESVPGQKMYSASFQYKGGGFLVFKSDLAADRVASGPDKNLDLLRDTSIKAMNANVIKEQSETVGKFPARRVDYGSNNFSGTLLFVIAGRRIYQVNAIGPAGFTDAPETKRFLSSFAVLGQ